MKTNPTTQANDSTGSPQPPKKFHDGQQLLVGFYFVFQAKVESGVIVPDPVTSTTGPFQGAVAAVWVFEQTTDDGGATEHWVFSHRYAETIQPSSSNPSAVMMFVHSTSILSFSAFKDAFDEESSISYVRASCTPGRTTIP